MKNMWICVGKIQFLFMYANHVQDAACGPGPARDPILSGPRDVPKILMGTGPRHVIDHPYTTQ